MKDKKLFIFDLDGTLTLSKAYLQANMAEALEKLLRLKQVAIISGCSYKQMYEQFLVPLRDRVVYKDSFQSMMRKLYLLPASGSSLYCWNPYERRFEYRYKQELTLRQKAKIVQVYDMVSQSVSFQGSFKHREVYGPVEEDRVSQITFSLLGQQAPLEEKEKFDPDRKKREELRDLMMSLLPEFEVRIGGTTSIDVTFSGIDKAYGITKLLETQYFRHPKVFKKDILFIGDALYEGGNDAAVKKLNIDCKQVDSLNDTLNIINSVVGEE